MPPLLDLAERGVDGLECGLVAASDAGVVVVAVRDGRAGRAEGTAQDVERLVKAAWLRAGQMRAWRVPALPPATVGEVDRGGAIREAIATTWGTRTFETREPAEAVAGRPVRRARLDDGRVLGPGAVAELLRALGPVLGVELALGEPPPAVAPAVTLVDDGADVHAFDAEGSARQRVTIIDRGRFVEGVRDSATGPTTGHATRALTASASARHLRLEPTTDALPAPTVHRLPRLRSAEARELLARVEAVA